MTPVILGTAQWGSDYGITNAVGRLSDPAVESVMLEAQRLGVRALDTAPAYGDAQKRMAPWSKDFSITTKVSGALGVHLLEQLEQSLSDMEISVADRCLIHDWPSLNDQERAQAVSVLTDAKSRGLVAEIGISIYSDADLEGADQIIDALSVVQLPVNVVDQRLEHSAAIQRLRARGWAVQARSIFLQGLLASETNDVLSQHPDLARVRLEAERAGLSSMELAAGYVATRPWVDEVVLGVTSAAELRACVSILAEPLVPEGIAWDALASSDVNLIDPRRW